MYNGKGLQTPRGSATNGYVQANRFSTRRNPAPHAAGISGENSAAENRTAAEKKESVEEVAERARKREIEIKLLVLEEEMLDQGYSDDDVIKKVAEARRILETGL